MKSRLIINLDRAGLAIILLFAIGGLLWTAGSIVIQKRQLQQAKDRTVRELQDLKLAQSNLHALQTALRQVRGEMAGLYNRIPPQVKMGVLVKDLDKGLCDFAYMMDGRVVHLCWKLGESEIGWWHETNAGFAGRQPLEKE